MKCPFELPVRVEEDKIAGFNIVDKNGEVVQWHATKESADYIVQAINCREKLANALNNYGNHLPKCKYLQGLKGQVIEDCDCGFEQALEENP